MALENPIGNPLEPQNRPQFTAEFNTLGPVDDSMIGGTAAASAIGIGTDFGSPHGPVADDADPAALREAVTSPGGTTEQALKVFAEGGLVELTEKAVRASAEKGAAMEEQFRR